MMDKVLNFLADNYLIFMIVAVVLLFALIGFIVDGKKKKQKNAEVVPATNVPPQPLPAAVAANTAPQAETVTAAPAPAVAPQEPSLSGLEATANDVNINTSTPVTPVAPVVETPVQPAAPAEAPVESIFNTPAVEPAAPANEQPTLVIEEPQTAAPATEAPAPEVMAAPAIGETPSVPAPAAAEAPTVPVPPASETPQAPQAPVGQ